MTFPILTYIFVMAAKKLSFYGEKKDTNFCQAKIFLRFPLKIKI